ncbi:positive regulation of protein localization to ciliary membrane [Sparganum proliferum]
MVSSCLFQESSVFQGVLKAGKVVVVPFTVFGTFKSSGLEGSAAADNTSLTRRRADGTAICFTDAAKKSLGEVFAMCDWDGNGVLRQDELAFYLYQTEGENLGGEEWKSWKKARGGNNEEITLEDFYQFHLEQTDNKGGDIQALWPVLRAFGFNGRLQLQQAISYNLTISARLSESKVMVAVEHIYREVFDCDDVEYYLARWITSRGSLIPVNSEAKHQMPKEDFELWALSLPEARFFAIKANNKKATTKKADPMSDFFQIHLSGAVNAHFGPGLLVKTSPFLGPHGPIAGALEYIVESVRTGSQLLTTILADSPKEKAIVNFQGRVLGPGAQGHCVLRSKERGEKET